MRLEARIALLTALAGAGCARDAGLAEELDACDVVNIQSDGYRIAHETRSYSATGVLARRVCDGCDGRGMDGVPDDIDEVSRDDAGREVTATVTLVEGIPQFARSETTTDVLGCPVERRFWRGTPQDWALDRTTCDAEGRRARAVEDLALGLAPGKPRTLRYDRRGRLVEELFDRDMDGVYEERTRWRYGRWRLPIRRDWYLKGALVARSDYARAEGGALLLDTYDYLVDGHIEVRQLYGYGCGAP